jgi:uncharacterized protein YbjT (DUF2867 family)
MTIGISGASGQLGRATTDLLLERVEPGELVLVTRVALRSGTATIAIRARCPMPTVVSTRCS